MKPTRRKLTARELDMRKRYTRIVKFTDGYSVLLQIDHQGFIINSIRDHKKEAEWTRDMLAIALARIK